MRRAIPFWLLVTIATFGSAVAIGGPGPVPGPVPTKGLLEKVAPLIAGSATSVQQDRMRGEKAPPALDALVVFCEFQDQVFYGNEEPGAPVDSAFVEFHYSARDSVYYDHHLTDVGEYYHVASGGDFAFSFTIHSEVVVLPHDMGWYGNHPEEGEQAVLLARDVIAAVEAQSAPPTFGANRTVFLIHAGSGGETNNGSDPDQIFSTYLDPESFEEAVEDEILEEAWLPVDDGVNQLDQVLILPETAFQEGATWGSLGIYCYLLGQRLGMLPLGLGERSWGIGSLGIMGWGLYAAGGWNPPLPCAYNKWLMGWIDPVTVVPGEPQDLTLTPARDAATATSCAKVEIGAGEYWLLEYRQQDPDGNRRWSFGDDRNRNGRRDYLNMSEPDSLPVEGETFDPEVDEREWLIGAEWDFSMTYNGRPAGGPEDTGRGSGIYVWHVDESVIRSYLAAGTRLVNWNPARKGVDVEEADGVQDMDSYLSEVMYSLGHENDVYQGVEALFGPDTRPRTDTATAAATGVLYAGFSEVLVNDESYPLDEPAADGGTWGYEYAAQMNVTVSRSAGGGGPVPAAERVMPAGVDLHGSHVLIADLDPGTPGAHGEIVLGANEGQVFVLDGDLNGFGDAAPIDLEPFAVGMAAGEPVDWNLPAAVGDLDRDGMPDIVLTGPGGLYAFGADGQPLDGVDPQNFGLYAALDTCSLPPVLVPVDPEAEPDPGLPVLAAVIVRVDGTARMQLFDDDPTAPYLDLDLGEVVVRAPPVQAFGRLWVAAADTVAGDHRLLGCATDAATVETVVSFALTQEPGDLVPTWGFESGSGDDRRRWLAVIGTDGTGETVLLDGNLQPAGANQLWPDDVGVYSDPGAGGIVGEGVFGRVGPAGNWQNGWPQRPDPGFVPPDSGSIAGAVSARLLASSRPDDQLIFTAPDGRLFAYGPQGEAEAGWPLAGPGASAGTPALGEVAGDIYDELVAIGTFARIVSVDADTGELTTEPRSVVTVWHDLALGGGTWTMWGGSPWRNGFWDASDASIPTATGTGIVSGSHICYPSPLTERVMQVRARLRGSGRVRVHVYNLEGERVTTTNWQTVMAQNPFDVPVDLGGAVSGMYICRLEAQSDGGGTESSVVSFAISR